MDEADRAQLLEEAERAEAERRATAPRWTPQPVTDARGRTVCLDCGERLLRARIEAAPGAVRCVPCQADYEKRARP